MLKIGDGKYRYTDDTIVFSEIKEPDDGFVGWGYVKRCRQG